MVKSKTTLVVIMLFIASESILSIFFHDPQTPVPFSLLGFKYSDIVYGVFYAKFSISLLHEPNQLNQIWFNKNVYSLFIEGRHVYPVPYVDYLFEYPPLIGLIWWVSTSIAFSIAYNGSTNVQSYINSAANINFLVNSVINFVFYVILIYTTWLVLKLMNMNEKRILLFAFSASMFIYLYYNWDIIASSLAILGLYMFLKEKTFSSGLFLGLSFSAKILTIGLAGYLFFYLISRHRNKIYKYIEGFAIGGIIPFVLLAVISPIGFKAFVFHNADWYCENCVWMLITSNIYSSVNKFLYYSTMSSLLLYTFIKGYKEDLSPNLIFISSAAPIVFNYIFAPQLLLMLIPIAYLTLKNRILKVFYIADFLNALGIITFFEDVQLRKLLGLKPVFDPFTLPSPTQLIFLIRNIILIAIILYILMEDIISFHHGHKKLNKKANLVDFFRNIERELTSKIL